MTPETFSRYDTVDYLTSAPDHRGLAGRHRAQLVVVADEVGVGWFIALERREKPPSRSA